MTLEIKPDEWVLVRSRETDHVYVIKADNWADYKWEMRPPRNLEVVVSGEKGYITMLERLANDRYNAATKEYA
jgi:hypothetical protein